jgi:hypothetical protein
MLAATADQIQVFAGEHVSLLQSRLDFVQESYQKGASIEKEGACAASEWLQYSFSPRVSSKGHHLFCNASGG